jgi:C4-dicarboxylate-specific signal transduction histidine kinase
LETETILLEVMFPNEPVRVRAEEIRLEQVVVNLLSNAVDAVRGRAPRRIGLRVERAAGRVRLMVSDTVPGLKKHTQGDLRSLLHDQAGGRRPGLGLSISYNSPAISAAPSRSPPRARRDDLRARLEEADDRRIGRARGG